MKIRNFEIGAGKTFVIAELCSNIIGHLDNLPNIVKWCKESGADGVKLQLFSHRHFPESEQEQKKRVEFPREQYQEFVNLCHAYDLAAGASVFDRDAVDLAMDSSSDFIKLATREWNNRKLILRCLSIELPIIRSYDTTGIENEINKNWYPSEKNIIHMACVPQYPAESFRISHFGNPFYYNASNVDGWSSHTRHWNDVIIAVSRGASIIEKHVGFDKNDPEIGWSLYLDEFEEMCKTIRWTEKVR